MYWVVVLQPVTLLKKIYYCFELYAYRTFPWKETSLLYFMAASQKSETDVEQSISYTALIITKIDAKSIKK